LIETGNVSTGPRSSIRILLELDTVDEISIVAAIGRGLNGCLGVDVKFLCVTQQLFVEFAGQDFKGHLCSFRSTSHERIGKC
jgi:hypothetical protein